MMGIAVPLQEDIEAGFRAARVRSIAPLGPVGIRCAALSLILLTLAQAAAADLTMHRKLAGTPDPYGWYLAESTRGAFSVMLPVPFNDFTATTTATDEPVLRSEIVGSTSAEGIKFLASRHYYREVGAAENYFNAFATGSKGAAPRRFAFQQHKAIGIEISLGNTVALQRAILVGDTLVLLVVEWPKDDGELARRLASDFFASLQVEK